MAPAWTWDKSLIYNICNSHFQKYCKSRPANVPRKKKYEKRRMVFVREIYQIHILCRWRQDGYGISLKFITFATLMFKNTESLGLQMHGKEKT